MVFSKESRALHTPLDARQHRGTVVCGTPPILQNVQTQLARGVDVGVEHLADELDGGRLVRILLLEMHHESESAILEGRVGGSDNDSVPERVGIS